MYFHVFYATLKLWTHPDRSKILRLAGGDLPGKVPQHALHMCLCHFEQMIQMQFRTQEINSYNARESWILHLHGAFDFKLLYNILLAFSSI